MLLHLSQDMYNDSVTSGFPFVNVPVLSKALPLNDLTFLNERRL